MAVSKWDARKWDARFRETSEQYIARIEQTRKLVEKAEKRFPGLDEFAARHEFAARQPRGVTK